MPFLLNVVLQILTVPITMLTIMGELVSFPNFTLCYQIKSHHFSFIEQEKKSKKKS